jgi:hypothetical protein
VIDVRTLTIAPSLPVKGMLSEFLMIDDVLRAGLLPKSSVYRKIEQKCLSNSFPNCEHKPLFSEASGERLPVTS